MFLRCKKRRKDGKEHLYWSVVENRRVVGGRVLQRHVIYLGELNGRQEEVWSKSIDHFSEEGAAPQQTSLFPEEHLPATSSHEDATPAIGIRLGLMRLERPRQEGACWLGCQLWQQLGLDTFWRDKLPPGRKGARWDQIIQTLALYRLIDPGSEWRLHPMPFGNTIQCTKFKRVMESALAGARRRPGSCWRQRAGRHES